jgi:hypothetical protein
MNFFLISDYLPDEVLGGCEINNAELADVLRARGHQVIEKKSIFIETNDIIDNPHVCYIVSNFIELNPACIEELKKTKYVIYEHDHKYLRSRNPAHYKDFKAPAEELINLDFYRHAQAVFCQSDFHGDIIKKNTGLRNIVSVAGNLWSEESLALMGEIASVEKEDCAAILNSPIPHKNTLDTIRYCQYANRRHELISSNNYHSFLKQMGRNNEFIFFPKTPETLSRVVCEARMMNMVVTTNNLVGATSESWFALKGKDLIARMLTQRVEIAVMVEGAFREESHANTL